MVRKYSVVDKGKCACNRPIDLVTEQQAPKTELLSYHLDPSGKGFCPMSLTQTVKTC